MYNASLTQLQTTVKNVTGEDASYSISLVPDVYTVSEVAGGRKKWLGNIQIFTDSAPGTLNEYLTSFQADQVRPSILAQMEEILEETKSAAAAAGVTPRGAFAADVEYSINDLVEFNGSEYRATADIIGTVPPAAPWELFVAAGEDGPANALAIGSVDTLPGGSAVTATITGGAPNQTLSFAIPQGESGAVVIPDLNTTGCNLCAVVYNSFNPGDEAAGSQVKYGGIRTVNGTISIGEYTTRSMSGTWRCQGHAYIAASGDAAFVSFVRIDTDADGLLTAENYSDSVRNLAKPSPENLCNCNHHQAE